MEPSPPLTCFRCLFQLEIKCKPEQHTTEQAGSNSTPALFTCPRAKRRVTAYLSVICCCCLSPIIGRCVLTDNQASCLLLFQQIQTDQTGLEAPQVVFFIPVCECVVKLTRCSVLLHWSEGRHSPKVDFLILCLMTSSVCLKSDEHF